MSSPASAPRTSTRLVSATGCAASSSPELSSTKRRSAPERVSVSALPPGSASYDIGAEAAAGAAGASARARTSIHARYTRRRYDSGPPGARIRPMILDRSMTDSWLSNTYLIGDVAGGEGAFIDAGGPIGPLVDAVDRHALSITHILLTHHHHDHVAELGDLLERFPDAAVLAHPDERVPGVNETIQPGDRVQVGELEVEAIATPGHTKGMLSFRVGNAVFTGDTLFK